jgi:putative lipoprotein
VHEVLVRRTLLAAVLLAAPAVHAADADPAAPRYLVRGAMMMEGAVPVFKACGDKGREYTLVDASDGDVSRVYRELAAAPGAPVFMEIRGVVFSAPAAAPARLEFRAERLERAERQGPGCRRALGRLEALALGSSPAWQVEIAPSGVVFASLDERGTMMFPARTGDWPADGALRYEGANGGATLALTLSPERCRDGTTGNLYALAARAVLNGTEYRGCAIRGRSGVTPAAKPAR